MELTNDFHVKLAPAATWALLTDVERIAPCMPGAQLQEIEGDEHRGVVKVKVGPITAQYKGAATFVEKDETTHKMVLKAEGRETRGQGNASAMVTATLAPDGSGTKVSLVIDLTVTGKVAQFGRGVMADVSAKLLGQFVECLHDKVLGGDDEPSSDPSPATTPAEQAPAAAPTVAAPAPTDVPAAEAPAAEAPAVRKIDHPEPDHVDLLQTAGSPVAKRVAPILAIVALGWLVRTLVRRRRK